MSFLLLFCWRAVRCSPQVAKQGRGGSAGLRPVLLRRRRRRLHRRPERDRHHLRGEYACASAAATSAAHGLLSYIVEIGGMDKSHACTLPLLLPLLPRMSCCRIWSKFGGMKKSHAARRLGSLPTVSAAATHGLCRTWSKIRRIDTSRCSIRYTWFDRCLRRLLRLQAVMGCWVRFLMPLSPVKLLRVVVLEPIRPPSLLVPGCSLSVLQSQVVRSACFHP